ncbi:hypothetical protein BLA29_008954, partial [Euroglyphus maynei]
MSKSSSGNSSGGSGGSSHHGLSSLSSSTTKTPSPAHLNNPTYHHGTGRSPYNYNPLTAPPPPPPPTLTKHRNSSSGHPDSPHTNFNAAHTSSSKSTASLNNRAISSASSPNLAYQDLRHSSSSSSKHNQIIPPNVPSPVSNHQVVGDNGNSNSGNNVVLTKEQILLQKQLATLKQAMRKH